MVKIVSLYSIYVCVCVLYMRARALAYTSDYGLLKLKQGRDYERRFLPASHLKHQKTYNLFIFGI